MSSQPRPESRLSELEAKMAIQDARIRELSEDAAEEFRALRQDNKALFQHVQQGFEQANALIKETASKEDIAELRSDIATTVASKGNIDGLDTRLSIVEQRMSMMEGKLDQILQLMQK